MTICGARYSVGDRLYGAMTTFGNKARLGIQLGRPIPIRDSQSVVHVTSYECSRALVRVRLVNSLDDEERVRAQFS